MYFRGRCRIGCAAPKMHIDVYRSKNLSKRIMAPGYIRHRCALRSGTTQTHTRAHEKGTAEPRDLDLCAALALLRLRCCQSGHSSRARFVLRDMKINASRAE